MTETDTCTFTVNGKKCWMTKTHWHPIYGELCAKHAAELMASGDKKVKQRSPKKEDPLAGIVPDKEAGLDLIRSLTRD